MKRFARAQHIQHERNNPSAHRTGRGHSRFPYKIANLSTWPELDNRFFFFSIHIRHAVKTCMGIFMESGLFRACFLKFSISLLKLKDFWEQVWAWFSTTNCNLRTAWFCRASVLWQQRGRHLGERQGDLFTYFKKFKVELGSVSWLLLCPYFVILHWNWTFFPV